MHAIGPTQPLPTALTFMSITGLFDSEVYEAVVIDESIFGIRLRHTDHPTAVTDVVL